MQPSIQQTPSLYVIIAAYGEQNLPALIRELLQQLRLDGRVAARIVVVDNGAAQRPVQSILPQEPWLVYFPMQTNVGVSAAWNIGLRFALANGARFVLLAGSDTCPRPGTVSRLLNHAFAGVPFITGTQIAPGAYAEASGGKHLLAAPDFSFALFDLQVVTSKIAFWDWETAFQARLRHEVMASNLLTSGVDAWVPSGSIDLPMNPAEWGLFDETFFPGYFEDNDLAARAKVAGILMLRDPDALFDHACSNTMHEFPEVAELVKEWFPRNAERFRQKWGGLPHELNLMHGRPTNVTDEQWERMTGGMPVLEVDIDEARRAGERVYAAYGIATGQTDR